MSVNPCQDPTPEQEAIYERDCEIAALKEQIREVRKIIATCLGQDLYQALFRCACRSSNGKPSLIRCPRANVLDHKTLGGRCGIWRVMEPSNSAIWMPTIRNPLASGVSGQQG